jgi:transcriptional regulator with XRE-family HTH domain
LAAIPDETTARTADPETLGALVARVRMEQGISQLRLAERLCAASAQPTVTRHEISRWEREERIPTRHWLGWLAAVLELPLVELERAAAQARRARARRAPDPPFPLDRTPWPSPGYVQLAPGVFRRAS